MTGLGLDGVLPVTGSKELIGSMALHLGIGPGDLIGYPALAYPTYEVGAALAGADSLATDSLTAFGPRTPRLLWLNSPANPTGRVLPLAHLRKVVDWCRERGTVLVSDECYIECAWSDDPAERPLSILDPQVNGGSLDGILAVHSLSKRSNLAGYRCAFLAGDPALVGELLAVRKNLGLQMPGPQQRAMIAALDDDAHVDVQRATYAARRAAAEGRARGRRLPHRPLRGLPLPLGDPGRGLLADGGRARRAGDPRGAGRVLRPDRTPARARRLHRDRRAGRRRGRPPLGLTAARRGVLTPGGGCQTACQVQGSPLEPGIPPTPAASVEDVDVHVVAVLQDRPVAA